MIIVSLFLPVFVASLHLLPLLASSLRGTLDVEAAEGTLVACGALAVDGHQLGLGRPVLAVGREIRLLRTIA